MNKKKLALFLLPMLAIGFVFAGIYVVNNITIKSDVYEPFNVSLVILGNGGNYEGTPTCGNYTGVWKLMDDVESPFDVDGINPGEARKFCVKINNLGEGDIPYVIQSKVKSGLSNYAKCSEAFPDVTITGIANGSIETIDEQLIEIPVDSPPVEDCEIEISVSRGTL